MSQSVNTVIDAQPNQLRDPCADAPTCDEFNLQNMLKEKAEERKKKEVSNPDITPPITINSFPVQQNIGLLQGKLGDQLVTKAMQPDLASAPVCRDTIADYSFLENEVKGSGAGAKAIKARILARSQQKNPPVLQGGSDPATTETVQKNAKTITQAKESSTTAPVQQETQPASAVASQSMPGSPSGTELKSSPTNLSNPNQNTSALPMGAAVQSPVVQVGKKPNLSTLVPPGVKSRLPESVRTVASGGVIKNDEARSRLDPGENLGTADPVDPATDKMSPEFLNKQKKHEVDDGNTQDSGLAATGKNNQFDAPIYTKSPEQFGGPKQQAAAQSPTPNPTPTPDKQSITYNFTTWGNGNSVEITNTADRGYELKASNSDVAKVLHARAPENGPLSLRIETSETDPDKLLALRGSTDSEKQKQSNE